MEPYLTSCWAWTLHPKRFFACLTEIQSHKKFGVRSFNYMPGLNISGLGGAMEPGCSIYHLQRFEIMYIQNLV